MEPTNSPEPKSRFMAFRVIAALTVIAMALLGILLVFDFVTQDGFKELALKVFILAGILAAASLLLGVLSARSD